jgi:hypothetical protein
MSKAQLVITAVVLEGRSKAQVVHQRAYRAVPNWSPLSHAGMIRRLEGRHGVVEVSPA